MTDSSLKSKLSLLVSNIIPASPTDKKDHVVCPAVSVKTQISAVVQQAIDAFAEYVKKINYNILPKNFVRSHGTADTTLNL